MSSKTGIDGSPLRLLPIFAALILPLTGLAADGIQTYRVPKDPAHAKVPATAAEVPKQSSKPLTWTLPEGWKELASSGVRVGSFSLTGTNGATAQLSIMPFGGMVGGELANVNRWRREVGMEPIEESGIVSGPVQVGVDPAKIYEVVGEKEETIVAWLFTNETSWFFKLRGDKATVAEAKTTFVAFLKTIRFVANPSLEAANAVGENPMDNPHSTGLPTSEAPMGMGDIPSGHPPVGGAMPAGHPTVGMGEMPSGHPVVGAVDSMASMATNMPADPQDPKLPVWQVPASWKALPASRMVLKSFLAGDEKTKAIITISSFPGEVGGMLANVNRWRGQLKLQAITEGDLSKYVKPIETKDGKASLVEMDSETVRLVGVIVPHAGSTWFYKMMGDAGVVDREKQNLVTLAQSAQYR